VVVSLTDLLTNSQPFETVAGLLTTPIDRLGDMLRKFPKEE